MKGRWLLVSLAVGVAAPSGASAQQTPRSPFPDPKIYTEELSPRQIQRAQEAERPPAAGFPAARGFPADRAFPPAATQAPKRKPHALPGRSVACGGAFAKDSSHLKLATAYKSENVVYMEVDASEGKKLMASVLFPKDPKQRLEVWWENEDTRSGTYLIVINGKSTWGAPKGLKLGLQLAALERLNHKPFKLRGFSKGSNASVSDWQGGALGSLAGGCKVGVFLRADPKAPPNAIERATAELASNDDAIKAVKPAIAEIIIGY